MSRAAIALGGLVLAVAAGALGYWGGHSAGAGAERARQDAQTVKQLGDVLEAHKGLVNNANAASQRLRAAMAERSRADAAFSKEFRDALATNARDRDGCRFDDGIVRQLAAARNRAAAAATAGSAAAAVPAAAGGARQ